MEALEDDGRKSGEAVHVHRGQTNTALVLRRANKVDYDLSPSMDVTLAIEWATPLVEIEGKRRAIEHGICIIDACLVSSLHVILQIQMHVLQVETTVLRMQRSKKLLADTGTPTPATKARILV